jgi:hypothetical protein
MREEDRAQYWDRKWKLKEQHLHEHVTPDGSDEEREFEHDVLV